MVEVIRHLTHGQVGHQVEGDEKSLDEGGLAPSGYVHQSAHHAEHLAIELPKMFPYQEDGGVDAQWKTLGRFCRGLLLLLRVELLDPSKTCVERLLEKSLLIPWRSSSVLVGVYFLPGTCCNIAREFSIIAVLENFCQKERALY